MVFQQASSIICGLANRRKTYSLCFCKSLTLTDLVSRRSHLDQARPMDGFREGQGLQQAAS